MKVRFRALLERLLPSALVALLLLQFPMPAGAFHFPWDQGHDTFQPDPPDDDQEPPSEDDPACHGEPVHLKTGEFYHFDFPFNISIKGKGPDLALQFYYHSRDGHQGPFGLGWHTTLTKRLMYTTDGQSTFAIMRDVNGRRKRFDQQSDGSFSAGPGIFAGLQGNADGSLTLSRPDGVREEYDAAGRLRSLTDRNGNQVLIEYDASGVISTATDPSGRSLEFTKGPSGKIESVTDPLGRVYQFAYNADGTLASVTDPMGGLWQYQYDASLRMTAMIGPDGTVLVANTYDSDGRVVSQTVAGAVTRFEYVSATRTDVIDPRGNRIQYNFNECCGNPTTTVDAEGITTVKEWDDDYNLISFTDGRGFTTSFEYDSRGNVVRRIDPDGGVHVYSYDTVHNLLSGYTNPLGFSFQLEYDARGNLVRVTDATSAQTHFTVNAEGLVTESTDAVGRTTRYSYDANGYLTRVVDPSGNETVYTHDLVGNVTSVRDAEGRVTRFQFNDLNLVTAETDPAGNVTRYEYDAYGNLVATIDPAGRRRSYRYDAASRIVAEIDPLGQQSTASYDGNGNLVELVRRDGRRIQFQYDRANRLVRKQLQSGETLTYQYDAANNLVRAENGSAVIAMSYDPVNRRTGFSTAGSARQPAVSGEYGYDAAGRRVQFTVSGLSIDYQRDPLGRLTRLSGPGGMMFEFDFDGGGRLMTVRAPFETETHFAWNSSGNLAELEYTSASGRLAAFSYDYDRVGNRVGIGIDMPGASVDETLALQYDPNDQLIEVSDGSGTLEGFAYDDARNRIHEEGPGDGAAYDANNRLLEDGRATYEYDANGNLTAVIDKTSGQRTELVFDEENKLLRVTQAGSVVAEYFYDPFGRRCEKRVGDVVTQYVYDHGNLLAEYDGAGQLRRFHVYGDGVDELLASLSDVDGDGNLEMTEGVVHVRDAIGSVMGGVDPTGILSDARLYSAFGVLRGGAGALPSPFGFAGREFDAETGWYFFRARYYHPQLGRFLSEDPLGTAGGLNYYLYAENNPATLVDPSGELAWFVAPIIGGLIGGGIDLVWQLYQNDGNIRCVDWGNVALSAGAGALFSSLGPSGVIFGRGGARAAAMGYRAGVFNTGRNLRVGWSWHQGRNWFSIHGGVPRTPGHFHYDLLPGPSGQGVLGFGVGGGVAGGAVGAGLGSSDCECP